jgi:hypothetical protein
MYKFLFNVEDDFIILLMFNFFDNDYIVYVFAVAVKHKMFGC